MSIFASAETREMYAWAEAGKTAQIKSASADADANWANMGANGTTPLHAATNGRHTAAVAALLERGANASAKRMTDLATPLHVACGNGDAATAALLLRAGAPADGANTYGNTPLHAACMSGDAATVRLIVDAPAVTVPEPQRGGVRGILLPLATSSRFAKANKKGSTAVHFLCYGAAPPSAEVLELVLAQEGADVAARDGDGATALHVAARMGYALAARRLANAPGMDAVEVLDAEGRCAAQLALEGGHAKLAADLAAGRELPRGTPGSALAATQLAAEKAVPAPAAPRRKTAAPSGGKAAPPPAETKKKKGGLFSRKK